VKPSAVHIAKKGTDGNVLSASIDKGIMAVAKVPERTTLETIVRNVERPLFICGGRRNYEFEKTWASLSVIALRST